MNPCIKNNYLRFGNIEPAEGDVFSGTLPVPSTQKTFGCFRVTQFQDSRRFSVFILKVITLLLLYSDTSKVGSKVVGSKVGSLL